MSLDLEFDDAQLAIAGALEVFCADQLSEDVLRASASEFPRELWRGLAELGVLGLGTADGDGGALEVTAAMEALGRAIFPGPLVQTYFANQVLPQELRDPVIQGLEVATVGRPPLLPWAPVADRWIELQDEQAWLAEPRTAVEPVETLGAEPWGRVELERGDALQGVARGLALMDIARSAYLVGAAERLLDDTSGHARTRVQFGRSIGEFQAVAHPLAQCALRIAGSRHLTRLAALRFDQEDESFAVDAAAARLSASRSALDTVYQSHQVFGAVGATLEGPVFPVSRRVRQLVSAPPDDRRQRELLLGSLGL